MLRRDAVVRHQPGQAPAGQVQRIHVDSCNTGTLITSLDY